ncbi:CoA-binding protein [Promineifilum sp.]|uniref:CoA-binding protein n=1 Tax=Promineifilum sp. TaxID=2664178 RepID=UPI0035B0E9B9
MSDAEQATIRHILTNYRVIAAVGYSDRDRTRANYYVPAYLKGQGYTVIPVNPGLAEGLGRPAYPSLADVPEPVDVALLYAPPAAIGGVVEQAIAHGVQAIWLPLGVVDDAAAARARAAGLLVVMDRCMMVEHKHLE